MNTTEFKMFLLNIVERIEKGQATLEQVEVNMPVTYEQTSAHDDGPGKGTQPETTIYIRLKNHS